MARRKMETDRRSEHLLDFDLSGQLTHGVLVSNIAYDVAREYGLSDKQCYELAVAGMLHDLGKLRLSAYVEGDQLMIEEMKYVRMHATLGYEALKDQGYSRFILESILYHHENYDGSGYPENLSGEDIPIGARILRVCDVFAALISNRPYRSALDVDTAFRLMIEEVKNFDMVVFLAFQRVVHEHIPSDRPMHCPEDIIRHFSVSTPEVKSRLMGDEINRKEQK